MSDEPEKVELSTPDLAAQRLAAFEDLFPGVVADGVLDVGRLTELLDIEPSVVPDGRERFGLMWAGKNEAVRSLLTQSRAALLPDFDNSIDFDTARNVFVEGDNLEVLKLLQKAYNDRVKLIYIDPPYNTGNDFVYNDDFTDGLRGYLEYTGQVDDHGRRTSAVSETAGRRHSGWLSMIYPRLVLARNLLKQDGAVLVSIDDNEAMNLKALMDEVFGQENFIAQMVWAAGRKNDSKFVSVSHEYILVYARSLAGLVQSAGRWRTRKEGLDDIYATYDRLRKQHRQDHGAVGEGLRAWFKSLPEDNPSKRHKHYGQVDARGIYFPDNASWPGGGGPKYRVLHPRTGKPVKIPSRGWIFQEPKMLEMIERDLIHFGADENSVPCVKSYLKDRETEVPYSVFYVDGRGATKRLRTLLGGAYFENPKDETVLQKLVEITTSGDELVMDFFAGSGSTAHAVALQNAADGGNRAYIIVNLPEPVPEDSAAMQDGLETVADITRLRLKRVIESVPGAAGGGLKAFRLASSSFRGVSVDATNLLDVDLSETTLSTSEPFIEDLAAEILLREGVALGTAWDRHSAGGDDVIIAHGVAVVTSLDITDDVVTDALNLMPRVVVFLEDGFAGNDAVKANAFTKAKNLGITMKTV